MKYCVIVPDGAADHPVGRLEGKTPLQVARTPNMDRAARDGLLGVTCHVPPRMTPGSSVAMLSLMGYSPADHFTGRGPLEAADLGIEMGPRDWAVRCNLITADGDVLADFTAGHISTEEAEVLIETLNEEMGSDELSFHVGTSYRHVMMYSGDHHLDAQTTPPHDIVGQQMIEHHPDGPGDQFLIGLMDMSRSVLARHEINQVRVDLGENPANMIWLWSPGKSPAMPRFEDRFGLRGGVISAVNLVRGIGALIGWKAIRVPGATGYTDTDYAAKGRYAIDALKEFDIVLVHIEAPDEASHEQDVHAKVRAIEQIDSKIVGPVMAYADEGQDLRLLVCPDHVTSIGDGKHQRGQVPFALWGHGVKAQSAVPFDESHAAATDVVIEPGHHLMAELIGTQPEEAEW